MTHDPAFPVQNAHYETTEPGMLLRDYFAAKAMQAYLTHQQILGTDLNTVAKWSYNVADTMLKVRGK